MKEKTYSLPHRRTVRELAHGLEAYFTLEEGLRCEVMRTKNGAYIVRGRDSHSEITQWIGMNRQISVRFIPEDESRVRVRIEPGNQEKKYVALAVGLFLLWGIALTSLWGILSQRLLVQRTRGFLRHLLEDEAVCSE